MPVRPQHEMREASNLFLKLGAEEVEKFAREALEQAAVIVEKEAKRVIGTYDYGWTPLAEATVARKAGGDTPLLETGELRDSIEHHTPLVGPLETFVGSNNPKAKWQELGTVTIPARSFLMGAAMHKEREIHEMLGKHIHAKIVEKMEERK